MNQENETNPAGARFHSGSICDCCKFLEGVTMGWGEMVQAEQGSVLEKAPPLRSREQDDAPAEKPAITLDMGEASREQGFRQNGCR